MWDTELDYIYEMDEDQNEEIQEHQSIIKRFSNYGNR